MRQFEEVKNNSATLRVMSSQQRIVGWSAEFMMYIPSLENHNIRILKIQTTEVDHQFTVFQEQRWTTKLHNAK